MTDRISEQPAPIPTDQTPTWDLVIADCRRHVLFDRESAWKAMVADMEARNAAGIEKYGCPLTTNNNRDSLVDLFQELLDAAAYSRNLAEQGAPDDAAARIHRSVVELCWRVRGMLLERDGE